MPTMLLLTAVIYSYGNPINNNCRLINTQRTTEPPIHLYDAVNVEVKAITTGLHPTAGGKRGVGVVVLGVTSLLSFFFLSRCLNEYLDHVQEPRTELLAIFNEACQFWSMTLNTSPLKAEGVVAILSMPCSVLTSERWDGYRFSLLRKCTHFFCVLFVLLFRCHFFIYHFHWQRLF
ncbi:hypothetical protein ANANG_G00103460 [Anguilla anguilla]|uniref:Uncharacterized protein n=1 Tax=Anguilla anguilla TaxID=7936 RepID=A0A9D3RZC2_ANGAN|nr:hypothetical protein ANANG_G00103460 [Anguilla anguilla]